MRCCVLKQQQIRGDLMAKKALSRELIISTAFGMVDEDGLDKFSVRSLAANLGCQASSLYNHIKNEHDILLEVAKLAAKAYVDHVEEYVKGVPLEEVTLKSADAFRVFLKEHRHLYYLMIDEDMIYDPEFAQSREIFTAPIYMILKIYGIEDKATMDHLYVAMRVITHGFATLDALGVFDHLSVDAVHSYHVLCQGIIDKMIEFGKKEKL